MEAVSVHQVAGPSIVSLDAEQPESISPVATEPALSVAESESSISTISETLQEGDGEGRSGKRNYSGSTDSGFCGRTRNVSTGQKRLRRRPHSLSFVPPIIPDTQEKDKGKHLRNNLSEKGSFIYCLFLVACGSVFHLSKKNAQGLPDIFNTSLVAVGIMWLIFLHWDLLKYTGSTLRSMKLSEEPPTPSTTEECVNSKPFSSYKFLRGRHSGSFYLKIGMAVFCFGHILYIILSLIKYYLHYAESKEEKFLTRLVLLFIWPMFSFYQLYIIFKYSNMVINQYIQLARFGLMHLIATSLNLWINCVVQSYNNSEKGTNDSNYLLEANTVVTVDNEGNRTNNQSFPSTYEAEVKNYLNFLYPFTIEYNLQLAVVWFSMWLNIGKNHFQAISHHFERKVGRHKGVKEVTYRSNLALNVDCHASMKGLFMGIFILGGTVFCIIIFLTTSSKDLKLIIYCAQQLGLATISFALTIAAMTKLRQLDYNLMCTTFLDDVLLFIPLPFAFIFVIINLFSIQNAYLNIIYAMSSVQMIVQTMMISDGLRRCSNSQYLKFHKPGREIITLLMICNLVYWLGNSTEMMSISVLEGCGLESTWVRNATVPMILFYRFHSSVCLADIWKNGYEKGTEIPWNATDRRDSVKYDTI